MAKKLTSAKAKEILHDKSVHGHPLTEKQRKFFGAIAGGAEPYKAEGGGWLDKYEQGGMVLKQKKQDNYGKKPNANDSDVSLPPDFKGWAYNTKGRNYSPAWGGQFQKGGELQKKRYEELYGPIENKVFDAVGTSDDYDRLPSSTRDFLDKTIAGFSVASNRNIPPMDPVIKEVQDKVKNLSKEEINKLLKTNWSKIGMAGAMKNTPSSVSYLDMLKYINHFNKLKKQGYTLETGGNLMPPMAGAPQPLPLYQMGGSLPGATGMMYARTINPAPSNGPYAKKTKASAQNGQEMKYYQEGLDFKPKTISQDGAVIDPEGYWNPENWGNPVIIPSTDITMEGVYEPLIGISDTGDVQYMEPGEDYEFDGEYVTEYPVARGGVSVNNADAQPIEKLDQLLNFTNYNKPTKGGWLDKYQ